MSTAPPPPVRANDWLTPGTVVRMLLTLLLLEAWLLALVVAWVRWTGRSLLESAALAALAAGVVAMTIGYGRSVLRQRKRYLALAARAVWLPGRVLGVARGPDPTGMEIGVRQGWIVTAELTLPDGNALVARSAPVRRLASVRDLIGRSVWVAVDPADPAHHLVRPDRPAPPIPDASPG